MTPAFGFSVGDFISTINLIRKITKALKETGGAASEYQDTVIELTGLQHALQHLEALQPTQDNAGQVNAIRGMALACKIPLQDFMTKLDKYEESLGPWAYGCSLGGLGRKTRWAVSFSKEVEKLRAMVAGKQISINLLLATHSSQTLSSTDHLTKQMYNAFEQRDEQLRAASGQAECAAQRLNDTMDNTAHKIEARLQDLSTKVDLSNTSIVNLKNIADQVVSFVKTFPQEIRDRLHAMTQADWRTYQAILQIQNDISRTPNALLESNIQFTNALGEHRSLPYEYFCQWEPFEGFLRAQFKRKPGESKVLLGDFHIIDSGRQDVICKERWNRRVLEGARLTMSMIMTHLRRLPGQCPQPSCSGIGVKSSKNPVQMVCDTCSLTFFQQTNELEEAFDRVMVSEDLVTRQQVEEDMRLYGARPEPAADAAFDPTSLPFEPGPKRNASHLNITAERSPKSRRIDDDGISSTKVLTAMDWNGGASPIAAWLNQSAMPSITPTKDEPDATDKLLLAQEVEEMKMFRNVHVKTAPCPASTDGDLIVDKDFARLSPRAQIFYRNIKDKFAHIPTYLARRLADANLDRAKRLQKRRQARVQPGLPLLEENPLLPIQQSNDTASPTFRVSNPSPTKLATMTDVPVCSPQPPLSEVRRRRDGTIACAYCRKRNIKCSLGEAPERRPCSNCTRFRQDCQLHHVKRWPSLQTSKPKAKKEATTTPSHSFFEQSSTANWGVNLVEIDDEERFLLQLGYETTGRWRDIAARVNTRFGTSYFAITIETRFTRLIQRLSRISWSENDTHALEQAHDYWETSQFEIIAVKMLDFGACERWSAEYCAQQWEAMHPRQSYGIRPQANQLDSKQTLTQALDQAYDYWEKSQFPIIAAKMLDFGASERWSTDYLTTKWKQIQAKSDESKPVKPNPEGFWNGGAPSRRPSSAASIHSRSSSMNSSLRGSSKLDPYEQDDTIPQVLPSSLRGLPGPPVDIKKQQTFNCDICGEVLQVLSRRIWQDHVMSDLRPFLCTFEDCPIGAETYAFNSEFMTHEQKSHGSHGDLCPFCQEIVPVQKRARGRHMGRHMEEIAFTVVPKPYEDWDFYSDSSKNSPQKRSPTFEDSTKDDNISATAEAYRNRHHSPFRCDRPNPTTGKPCNAVFPRAYDLTRHEDTIHSARKQRIRCIHCVEDKNFSRRDALTRHMRVVHPDVDYPGRKRRRAGNLRCSSFKVNK